MRSDELARGVLLIDAIGCAAALGATVALPSAFREVDPTMRARRPVALALGGMAAICAVGATTGPSRGAMLSAAAANAAWVGACLVALPRQQGRTGRALVVATAMLDGAAAAIQWQLRPRGERDG